MWAGLGAGAGLGFGQAAPLARQVDALGLATDLGGAARAAVSELVVDVVGVARADGHARHLVRVRVRVRVLTLILTLTLTVDMPGTARSKRSAHRRKCGP